MKTVKKILNKFTIVICLIIVYFAISPLIIIATLLNRSFMLGFVTQCSQILLKFQKKPDYKDFRKFDEKHYVAQPIYFRYEMRLHYDVGEKFGDVDFNNMRHNIDSGLIQEIVLKAGIEGFFKELILELAKVLGENTTLYNGYDLAENYFCIHFNIKKEAYEQAMKNIRNWAYANDYQKYIKYVV